MKRTTTLLLTCAALSVASCKKDKKTTTPDPVPVVNCDLVAKAFGGSDTTTYEYDSENRLIREFDNGQLYMSVEYLNNGNTVKETFSTSINTYQLNAAGFPTTVLYEQNTGQRSKNIYTYDANNFLTKLVSQSLNAQDSILSQDSITYTNTIANGNLIHQVLAGILNVEINIAHDLNRPNNAPVARRYTAPFYGGGRNDNDLMISAEITNGGQTDYNTFSYQYDSKGRITRRIVVVTGGSPDTDTAYYNYRCD